MLQDRQESQSETRREVGDEKKNWKRDQEGLRN